jgi:hypothetical protein
MAADEYQTEEEIVLGRLLVHFFLKKSALKIYI